VVWVGCLVWLVVGVQVEVDLILNLVRLLVELLDLFFHSQEEMFLENLHLEQLVVSLMLTIKIKYRRLKINFLVI